VPHPSAEPRTTRPRGAAVVLALAACLFGCQREHSRLLKEIEPPARAELRALALTRLAEIGREDDFHLFLKAAQDPSAVVRRAAAGALGGSGDSKAIDMLGELLSDADDEVQALAAGGLARFNTEKARAYLLSAYGRQGASARAAIAVALGPAGVVEAVRYEAKLLWDRNVRALESGGPAERVGAAEELGRSGRSEAVERLLPLLGDDSVLLAAGAARGLGAARDRRAVASLVGVLKENYPILREAAAEALGNLGDPSAVPSLEKMALAGGPGATAAVRALGLLGAAREARAALCRLASEGNLEVADLAARLSRGRSSCLVEPILARIAKGGAGQMAGLHALESLGATAPADKLLPLLDNPDRAVRAAAARALAEVGAASAGPRIEKALANEAEQVLSRRQRWIKAPLPLEAAPAAGGEPSAPESEAAALVDRDRSPSRFRNLMAKVDALREATAQALGVHLEDRESHAGLDLVSDELEGQAELLGALCVAAGKLHLAGALGVLQKLAADSPAPVQAASCEALATLGAPEALATAGECLLARDAGTVRAAARALGRAGGNGSAGQVLLSALEKRHGERGEIARALGELRYRPAAEKIVGLLGAGGIEAAEAAAALGRIGDASYAGRLAEQLKERAYPAHLDALESLGALGARASQPILERELCNDRPELRAAAARALGALSLQGNAPILESLRFDYYAEVRRAAEEALARAGRAPQGQP
jgi:HEAT repeat protein